MSWRQRAALLWLALVLACAAFVGLRFVQGSPLESDLLALLPPTERSARAEAAVKALSERLGNRVVFLVGHRDAGRAKALARDFASALRTSAAFARVVDAAPKIEPGVVLDTYAPYRAGLLSPADRAQLAGPGFDPEARLLRHIYQPFRTGIATDPALDPFGFLQSWLAGLPLAQGRLTVEDGLLLARDGELAYVFILAEPKGSAFAAAAQTAVVAAADQAAAALAAADPDARLVRTGPIFYGEAARSSAQAEVDLIGGGSLLGILLLLWLLFRSLQPLLLGLATVAAGIACGSAAVLAVQGKIHLITVVFGASLIGEAVDYAIQYFAAHLDAGEQWDPLAGLRRVLPGLAAALATSLIGYGALSLTPFPAVSQIALFAFAGLAAAWLSVLAFLPLLVRRPTRRRVEQAIALPRRILNAWRERATPRGVLVLALGVFALSVPGWWRLAANDDVRLLVARPGQLVADENLVRRLVGMSGSGRFFLVEGGSDEEVLQREEALTQRLRTRIGEGIAGYAAISDFVPSAATQESSRRLLAQALPAARVPPLLAAHDFHESAAAAWEKMQAATTPPLTLAVWRASPLAVPLQHQILPADAAGSALLVTLNGDDGSLDLDTIAEGLSGVSVVDKAGSVSALFAEYRRLAGTWLPAAVALVLGVLTWRYGLRTGLAILLPTLLAMGGALATYGYAGVPLTLFTVMGLVLVLGVGVNYAIFVVEGGDSAPAPFAGVLLSAATTVLSFGLLSLSSMPALHQFGLVLLAGVGYSVLLAPIALTLGKRRCA